MSGVNLAEVLLDEMVILDCEPFKDKENMFDVMTAKFEEAGFVSDAKAYKDALEYRESLGPTYMGNFVAILISVSIFAPFTPASIFRRASTDNPICSASCCLVILLAARNSFILSPLLTIS